MKVLNADWLSTKYKFLTEDIKKKGVSRAFFENLYEFGNKKKFKKLGVVHPDSCENLDLTNSKSVNKDSHENQPSTFYSLNKAFKQLNLSNQEIGMLDIGCGTGRVLSFGMLLNFKEVAGVDLDAPALEKAVENCTRMQKMGYKTSFNIEHADATIYSIPAGINVIYLFNPFGEKTMEKVVDNINSHAARSTSDIYVIYTNPKFQELFTRNKESKKIFESFFKNKKPDLAIFRIKAGSSNQL
jgi:predicted RNA methylase